MTGLFNDDTPDTIYLSRRDPDELLGTWSPHAIQLEDKVWPTAEHYFQAMQFPAEKDQERVRLAESAGTAQRIGEPGLFGRLFRRQRSDWAAVRSVYMTRAIYTKCRAWPEIATYLLSTGSERLVENSQYDYYWGCGRDLRGNNMYGQVLMNVRARLRDERDGAPLG